MSRHLISLIDGTMVSAARTETYTNYSNVFELACLLQLKDRSEDGLPQIVFYTSGISSQPDTSSIYNLATGNSIKSQIVDQYTNLCANFDFTRPEGRQTDKIYLIGFSRGAMAVRALAGLISEFGLLNPRDIRQLPRVIDAWDRSIGRGNLSGDVMLRDVEIEFVGLFDAVMGGIEKLSLFNPIRFSNYDLPSKCRNGVHIVAIDEDRRMFRPKLWTGRKPNGKTLPGKNEATYFKQVWMPGVHSDIGGTGNSVWGRASLLAMTHILDRATTISLDSQWLHDKESKLRASMLDGKYFIDCHRTSLHLTRKPGGDRKMNESYHPICESITECTYRRSRGYRWHDKVFAPRFNNLPVDPDLKDYFGSILS